jgi:hypothetical protein
LKKCANRLLFTFWLIICKLMQMRIDADVDPYFYWIRIRIQIYFMRMRIKVTKIMQIHNTASHCSRSNSQAIPAKGRELNAAVTEVVLFVSYRWSCLPTLPRTESWRLRGARLCSWCSSWRDLCTSTRGIDRTGQE